MHKNLPSLDLLKGFEAAARNLSFTKAAAELFVTQSAISRQIQALEREGIDLAIRYCTPKAAGAGAVRLFGELVFPECSRSVLAGRKLKSPQDLSGQVLLHYDDPERRYPWLSWDVWFELTQTRGVR